jgi:hypothetical protein
MNRWYERIFDTIVIALINSFYLFSGFSIECVTEIVLKKNNSIVAMGDATGEIRFS